MKVENNWYSNTCTWFFDDKFNEFCLIVDAVDIIGNA